MPSFMETPQKPKYLKALICNYDLVKVEKDAQRFHG
jgi:hypothetical protein